MAEKKEQPAQQTKKPVRKFKKSPTRRRQERREFLRSAGLAAGVLSLSLLGLMPVSKGKAARLRPPGALEEQEFLAACIKCGQCVQVCPVEAIELADIFDGVGIGAPYITARDQACDFSCDGLQCVLACPTGALTHEINYPAESRMGLAELVNESACLAVQGLGFKGAARGSDFPGTLRFEEVDRWNPIPLADHPFDLELCDLCVRLCPIEIRIAQCNAGKPPSNDPNQCPPKHAIELQPVADNGGETKMKPVILDGCVGCGVCEMVCPVEPTAIAIDYRKTVDTVARAL
ncbi:MAG TPA: 4Fe-4S dicluster domain-containing protein [Chromatiales bacterium]|nr:4Fe-4S dicluster domain-containing protein [Thiotrichales bacterium]HIP67060.1 4Fe-4S dicluster domain-containing protein [Chromatiales bacterium]